MNADLGDGDPHRTPDRCIQQDMTVEGLLRLGDGFTVDGDIRAPGGVILGNDVVIDGNIYTDGRVQMGDGTKVLGQIMPIDGQAAQGRPATPDDPRQAPEIERTREATDQALGDMQISTVEATMEILWELVCNEPLEDLGPDQAALTELEADALEDIQEGLRVLLSQAYEVPEGEEDTWNADQVTAVLLQRVLPMILTVEVTRLSPDRATVIVPRPTGPRAPHQTTGWPRRAHAFLEIMTTAVMPDAKVRPTAETHLGRTVNPEEITLELTFPKASVMTP